METSVIIPTFKRTGDLRRCLIGLERQMIRPDEVIVVVRDTDIETKNFIKGFSSSLTIKTVFVTMPGQVAALNKGLQSALGEYLCILDDDTIPHTDWLKRIIEIFKQSIEVGGVGGRDWVYHGTTREEGEKDVVGKVLWYGKVVGNHHLGYGNPRDVEVLKGANMSYRSEAIKGLKFDERLLGNGAQVHNDLAFSLSVKKKGWRLIYDPSVSVNHYPADRFDSDQRNIFNKDAYYFSVYNETLILKEFFDTRIRKITFILWSLIIGTSEKPGLLQVIRLASKNKNVFQKYLINIKTRLTL
ncbi:glycosyltransferase family 2 protein [Bacillus sp. B1-b2]|uniref:glycosyltransferase family 2 protein n=1 Tax=Bacillus sp. B1-b2 TaxID=2653201 RepID=UPI001261D029|nr:glycosyltransferase family 2 protein [Bacillus sp. B1-b2]KAB7671732.1 glycosyltransferase family 2 protein [Bacillus sp. B1-b2]